MMGMQNVLIRLILHLNIVQIKVCFNNALYFLNLTSENQKK